MEGAFAVLGGWLMLNETLSLRGLIGCAFMLSGMILSRMMGANRSKIVAYGTSGDVNKDYNSVVGYLSALLYKN